MKTKCKYAAQTLACLLASGLASGLRGQDTSAPPPPPAQVQEKAKSEAVPFHSVLAPHGTWRKVEPFGMVWQPTAVTFNSAWKPYSDNGSWKWRNNAWCWQSQYKWGWVPFHYGRWMRGTSVGWVWVPGTSWSPAWVSWERQSSAYRWAPLPVDRNVYASVSWNNGNGIQWSFTISDSHYSFAPARQFGAIEPTRQTVVVRPVEPAVTVVYRSEPVYYHPSSYSSRSYNHGSHSSSRDTHTSTRKPERHTPTRTTYTSRTRTPTKSRTPSRTPQQSTPQRSTTDRRTTGIANIMSRSKK